MQIFYNSTFISKEHLEEAEINHPIKLEYYKILNEDEMIKGDKAKFGIEVVKTEYMENNIKTEKEEIKYLSNDEKQIENILNIFKENEVTPIGVKDVITEISKQSILSNLQIIKK